MKKLTICKFFLVMMLILLARGGVKAQNVYLNEDFSSGSLPNEWTEEKDVTSSASWSYADGVATFNGGNKLGSSVAFLTNVVDLSKSIMPTLSFGYASQHSLGVVDSLVVYWRTADNVDWSTLFVNTDIQSSLTDVSFELTEQQQVDGFQLKFEVFNRYGGTVAIDNVRIINAIACTTPPTAFNIVSLSSESVTVMWTPAAYSDSSRVVVTNTPIDNLSSLESSDIEADVMLANSSRINMYLCSDLTPNTKYYAYVQSSCGSGDVSDFLTLDFITPCQAIEVGELYSEGFENGLGCWLRTSPSSTYAELSGDEKYAGDSSLYFYTDENQYSYVIAPFDVQLDTMQLSFYTYTEDIDLSNIYVGVVDNPGNLSNITTVQTVKPTKNKEWQKVIVTFYNYVGTGKYLVLYTGEAEDENFIYIDNVQLSPVSDCYEPLLPYADNIKAYSADLYWTEIGKSTSWNIRVSETELSEAEINASQSSDLIVAGTNPFTITNLEPSTTYYAYIQSSGCSWCYDAVVFKTPTILDLGYYDAFAQGEIEDMIPDWYYGNLKDANGNGNWVDYPYHTAYIYPELNTMNNTDNGSMGGSLRFYSYTTYNAVPYVIFPEVHKALDLDSVQLSFYLKQTNLQVPLVVSVCDGYDISTAVVIDTIYVNETSVWEEFIVSFENYTGIGRNIAFSTLFNTYFTLGVSYYLDDLRLDKLQSCNKITNVVVDEVGITEANISWSAPGAKAGTTWTIELYGEPKTGDADMQPLKTFTASTSSFKMTGLDMATRYYAYIRLNSANCSNSEWSDERYFRTLEEISLPYFNEFTDEPVGIGKGGPEGWICYTPGYSSTSYVPHVYKTTSWTKPPEDCTVPYLKFYTTTAYPHAYAVMPVMVDGIDMSKIEISFYGYGYLSSNDHNLVVGIMDDPNDTTTFTPIDSITTETYSTAYSYNVATDGYNGTGRYIAFKAWSDTKTVYFFLDNLSVRELTDCKVVSELEIEAPNATTLDVSWVKGRRETSWNVKVFGEEIAAKDVNETTIVPLVSTNVTTESATLTNFNHQNNFTYYVAVQGVGTDGCFSDWVVESYTTSCDYAYLDLPYTETFNEVGTGNIPGCWYFKGNASAYKAKLICSSSYPDYETGNTGGATLLLSAYASSSSSAGYSYAIMPAVDSLNYASVEFYYYKYNDNSYVEIGVMEGIDETYTDPKVYYTATPTNDALFTPLYRFDGGVSKSYEKVTYDFSSYQGEGKRIAFRVGKHTHYSYACYAVIDNITISRLTNCSEIRDTKITKVTGSSIAYDWSPLDESQWQVKVSTTEIDPATQNADVVNGELISSHPYTVTGLSENTQYYFYVRRVDANSDCEAVWSESLSQTTACSAISIGYVEDFESNYLIGEGNDVRCWSIYGTTDVLPYPEYHSADNTGRNRTPTDSICLAITNSTSSSSGVADIRTAYAILPELDVDSIKDVQISFSVYNPDDTGGQIEVGVTTNTTNFSSFSDTYVSVYKDTIEEGKWNTVRVKFTDYDSDDFGDAGKYIVISANPGLDDGEMTSNIIYIDDIVISNYAEGCEVPIRLKADSIGEEGLMLSWVANEVSEYEVMINRDGAIEPLTADTIVTVTSNPCVIEGLPVNTIQYASVRSKCTDGSYTDWSEVIKFYTYGCDAEKLPYFEGFEGYSENLNHIFNCQSWYFYDPDASRDNITYMSSMDMTGICMKMPSGRLCVLPMSNVSDLVMQVDLLVSFSPSSYVLELQLGVARWVGDSIAFIPLDTVVPETDDIVITNRINYSKYADQIQADDKIALLSVAHNTAGTYYYDIYIDNILVNSKDALWAPESTSIENIGTDAVTFISDLTSAPDAIEYAFMIDEQTVVNPELSIEVSEAPFDTVRLTGLTPNTNYRVAMRIKVDDEYSTWTNEIAFKTYQVPAQLPYYSDFENANQNKDWSFTMIDGTTTNPASVYWTINNSTAYKGNNSLYNTVNGFDYGLAAGYSYSWAMRSVEITDTGSYELSAIAKCPTTITNSTAHYLTIALLPAEYCEFGSVDYYLYSQITGDSWSATSTTADGTVAKIYKVDDWTSYSEIFDIKKPGLYNIVIFNRVYATSTVSFAPSAKPGAVDNIRLVKADLTVPSVSVTEITSSAAKLSWTITEGVTSSTVVIKDSLGVETTQTVIGSNELLLSGLFVDALYRVSIVNNKDEEQSGEAVFSFNTDFAEVNQLPYTQNFEDESENKNWTIDDEEPSNSWYIGEDTYYEGAKSLYVRDGSATKYDYGTGFTDSWACRNFIIANPGVYRIAMKVKCNTGDVDDFVSVSFIPAWYEIDYSEGEYTNTRTGELIDLSETSYDVNPYLVLDKFKDSKIWTYVYRDIYIDEAGSYKFAALFKTDNYTYTGDPGAIDSISVEEVICSGALNMTTAVDDNSASFSWVSSVSVTSWNIIVSTLDVTDPTTLAETDKVYSEVNRTTSNLQLTNLNAATTYYLYVQSNCSEGSVDYEVTEFTTYTTPLSIPYSQNFSIDLNYLPTNWSSLVAAVSLDAKVYDHAVCEKDTTLKMLTKSIAVLPYFGPLQNLEISFDAVAYNMASSTITIGYITDPNDEFTFVPLYEYDSPIYKSTTDTVFDRVYYNFADNIDADIDALIAIKAYYTHNIDDVLVDYSGGHCATPTDIDTTNVTTTKATVVWNSDISNSTRVVLSTVYAYDISTLQPSEIFVDTILPAGVSSCEFDIDHSTHYYVYVANNCTDKTSYASKMNFWTPVGVRDIPYYESFDIPTELADLARLGWGKVGGSLGFSSTYSHIGIDFYLGYGALEFPEFDPNYEVSDLMLDFGIMGWSTSTAYDVMVGVLETPGDTSSFVGIDTLYVPTKASASADCELTEYSVRLSGYTGSSRNLVFRCLSSNYVYLAYANLYEVPQCMAPYGISVSNISDVTADLSFIPTKGQSSWSVIVLDNAEATQDELNAMQAADAIFMAENINSYTDIELTGLKDLTTQYIYVKGNCDDVALWSEPVSFTTTMTPLVLPYSETFADIAEGSLPLGWYRSNSDIESELEFIAPSHYSYKEFAVSSGSNIASSPVLSAYLNSDGTESKSFMAISPEIVIDGTGKLGFDLTLTKGDGYTLPEDSIPAGRESEIRLVISVDNGLTYDEVVVIGDSVVDDYQLNNFMETNRVTYDVSPYVGDTIRFAFYIINSDAVYLNALIDNVTINCTGSRTYNDFISKGHDYTKNGFNIPYTELTPGVTTYETYIPSPELGVCDSTLTVNLTVLEAVVTNFTAEVCSGGSVYDKNGFTEYYPGLYLNRGIAVSGADSLTYLTLVAREPNAITPITDYVCEGSEYTFGDMVYTEAGIYYDTLADVNGCDSIIELTLSVVAGGETKYEIDTICAGDYYELGDTLYGETGVYKRELQTESGCDYTVELTLTVLDVDTTYVDKTIKLDELPYEYRDTVFDETTVVGEYTYEFEIDNGTECSDVEIYTLKVIEGEVAVDDTRILDLSMYPNPLTSGATLYVDAEFTAAERDGMVIEVMNTVGQLIVRETPATEEITVNGLTESGVYIVRITTGTGIQYIGKVIVK